jgi:hypothetical protein
MILADEIILWLDVPRELDDAAVQRACATARERLRAVLTSVNEAIAPARIGFDGDE